MSQLDTRPDDVAARDVEEVQQLLNQNYEPMSSLPPSPHLICISLPPMEDLEDLSDMMPITPPPTDGDPNRIQSPLLLFGLLDDEERNNPFGLADLLQSPGASIVALPVFEDEAPDAFGDTAPPPAYRQQLQLSEELQLVVRRARLGRGLDGFIARGGVLPIIQLTLIPTALLFISSLLLPRSPSSAAAFLFPHSSTYLLLLSTVLQILAICLDAVSTAFAEPPDTLDPDAPPTWGELFVVFSIVCTAAAISLFVVGSGLLALEYTSLGDGLTWAIPPTTMPRHRGRLRYLPWLTLALRR